jgi:hypothetical protein
MAACIVTRANVFSMFLKSVKSRWLRTPWISLLKDIEYRTRKTRDSKYGRVNTILGPGTVPWYCYTNPLPLSLWQIHKGRQNRDLSIVLPVTHAGTLTFILSVSPSRLRWCTDVLAATDSLGGPSAQWWTCKNIISTWFGILLHLFSFVKQTILYLLLDLLKAQKCNIASIAFFLSILRFKWPLAIAICSEKLIAVACWAPRKKTNSRPQRSNGIEPILTTRKQWRIIPSSQSCKF